MELLKMDIFKRIIAAAILVFPGMVSATVLLPALDIQNLAGDTGVSLTATTFDIDATAFSIVTGGTPIDIADESFTLTATGTFAGPIGSFAGSFVVGGGLLTGTFDNLSVVSLSGSNGQFLGDVTYTGGSLQGTLLGGRIEGVYSGADMAGKLGAVVPAPVGIWLFGSGLLGIILQARIKKVA
jgi:hypothetical protein